MIISTYGRKGDDKYEKNHLTYPRVKLSTQT